MTSFCITVRLIRLILFSFCPSVLLMKVVTWLITVVKKNLWSMYLISLTIRNKIYQLGSILGYWLRWFYSYRRTPFLRRTGLSPVWDFTCAHLNGAYLQTFPKQNLWNFQASQDHSTLIIRMCLVWENERKEVEEKKKEKWKTRKKKNFAI